MTKISQGNNTKTFHKMVYNFPPGWESIPLGEVTQPTRPKIKPSDKPMLPFIGMEHIEAHTMKLLGTVPANNMKSSAVHFKPGDILYGRLRPYLNKVYQPDFEGLCSAEFIVFPKRENVESKYLQYFLNSWDFVSFAAHLNEGDRPRVDFTQIASYPFPFAPTKEQRRIVAEIEKQFSRLDEAVAGLKRVKANLRRYKAAILKAAVEGKLTEQWRKEHPDIEPAKTFLDRILIERREQWEQSTLAKRREKGAEPEDGGWKDKYKEPNTPDYETLPPIPHGWHWVSTDQLFWFVTSGSRGWAKYYSSAGPLFLRVGNLDHDSISLDMADLQRVTPHKGAEGFRTRVQPNDILISITADVGMVGLIPDKFEEAYINQHISLVRPVSCIKPSYIAWYLVSRYGQKQFQHLQRGATKAGLGLDDIRSVNIPLPPAEEQKEIISQIEQRLSIVSEIDGEVNKNLKRADHLRQSILKKAFSGKLLH